MALIEHQTLEGKTGEIDLIKIKCETIDKEAAQEILGLILYFEKNTKKLYLDMKEVENVNFSIFYKLGGLKKKQECPDIVLYRCNNEIKEELIENDYHGFFDFVDNEKDL